MILKNPLSDFQIFTFSECKDDLTGLFTSQPITVVAHSTALAFRTHLQDHLATTGLSEKDHEKNRRKALDSEKEPIINR